MVGESPSDGSEGASTPTHTAHFGKNPISLELRTIFLYLLLLASNFFNWIHWKMKITKFLRFFFFALFFFSLFVVEALKEHFHFVNI